MIGPQQPLRKTPLQEEKKRRSLQTRRASQRERELRRLQVPLGMLGLPATRQVAPVSRLWTHIESRSAMLFRVRERGQE